MNRQISEVATRELLQKYPVARRFLVGFEGTSAPRELLELLKKGVAGVAIYPRNFISVDGLAALTAEIRATADGPLLIGIDQEGGTRFSLPEPFTQWASPSDLGRLGDAQAVRDVARAIGRELVASGCNLDFAPMLDVHVNPASPVTQVRSFGADPELVGRMGAAFLDGLGEAGVLGCAKHFPGHGDAEIDPHLDLPVFHGTAERLERVELVPFAAAISAGAATIMTAHILLPKIDGERPASLSRKIVTQILRERMEFRGLILADDLAMGAIARRFSIGDAAVATLSAGTDIAMLCHDISLVEPAMEATAKALEDGALSNEEWAAAGARIERVLGKIRPPRASLDLIGCEEHRALAKKLRERLKK
jgi:beta-N-acetylhexosaminidase